MVVVVLLCLCLWKMTTIFGYEIDCKNGCFGVQHCKDNEDCYITCNQPNSCKDTTFICSNKNCKVECANKYFNESSCIGTIFEAENAISFTINVNSNKHNEVWSFGTVKCPIYGECNINCNGLYTHGGICQHNQIFGINSKTVNIYGNGNFPIWDFDIHCPLQPGSLCNINVNNGSGLMDDVTLHSKQGFDNVNITCNNADELKCYTQFHEPYLECNEDECQIQPFLNNKWFCVDITNQCNTDSITQEINNIKAQDSYNVIIFKHTKWEIFQTQMVFWVLFIIVIILVLLCCVVISITIQNVSNSLAKRCKYNIHTSKPPSLQRNEPDIVSTLNGTCLASIKSNKDNNKIIKHNTKKEYNSDNDWSMSDSATQTFTQSIDTDSNQIVFSPDIKNIAMVNSDYDSIILHCESKMQELLPNFINNNHSNNNIDDINRVDNLHNIIKHLDKFDEGSGNKNGEFSILMNSESADFTFPQNLPALPIERNSNHNNNINNHRTTKTVESFKSIINIPLERRNSVLV